MMGESKIQKLKPILPSIKEKKRYLVYKIVCEQKIDIRDAKQAIDRQNLKFLGELLMSRANIMHINDLYNQNTGVIRVDNKYLNELKMSISLIRQINNKKAIVNPIYVSGVLAKIKKRYFNLR